MLYVDSCEIWFWNGSVLSKLLLLSLSKSYFVGASHAKCSTKINQLRILSKKSMVSLEIGEIRVDFNKLEKPSSMVS